MAQPKKATIDRLRALDAIERGQSVYITYRGNHSLFRKAMAGEQVLTPLMLYIYMTGRGPESFGRAQLADCVAALRRCGYKPDRAVLDFGRNAENVWIRTDVWEEDLYWDEQVKLARKEAMAKIGFLDMLEEEDGEPANEAQGLARAEAARAVD